MSELTDIHFRRFIGGRSFIWSDLTDEAKEKFRQSIITGENLEGADFRGADLRGFSFRNCFLTNAKFSDTILDGCDFSNCTLYSATFERATACLANFNNADMKYSRMDAGEFRGATFKHASLLGSTAQEADFRYADLSHTDLDCCEFQGSKLDHAIFKDAEMDGACFAGVNMSTVKGIPVATPIENLDAQILEVALLEDDEKFNMCDTTLCRAGHAVLLAGKEGQRLLDDHGWWMAGAAIYKASTGMIPEFHATDEEAIDDMVMAVEAAKKGK